MQTAARRARRRAAGGDAAHPHPPRPRRSDRGAGAALARAAGLRARARRPAPDRSLEAAGQRRAPLRRPDGAPLGRDRAGAGGQREESLGGGETVRGMRVAYTPGHASHHVCYLHEESGTAFVGDVAACRIPPSDLIMPPTPPPDIDVEVWEESLDLVASWSPERLALTHFGAGRGRRAWHLRVGPRPPARGGRAGSRRWTEDDYERRPAAPDPRADDRRRLGEERSRSCSRPSPPPTSGAASTATGASAPSAKRSRRLGEVLAHPLDRLGRCARRAWSGRCGRSPRRSARTSSPGETTTAASSSTISAKEVEVWPSGTGAQT